MIWCLNLFKNFPQFVVIHTVKGFSVVNKVELDVSVEFPCCLYNPMNVNNLISGSSAFSRHSLYIWKFSVHVLLRPHLENFEHYFASMWDECNFAVVWAFFGIVFLDLSCFFYDPADVGNLISGSKSKRVQKKNLLLLYWLHQSLWLCESQQTVGNSSRDGNTRPPYLPPEKSVCRSRSNS